MTDLVLLPAQAREEMLVDTALCNYPHHYRRILEARPAWVKERQAAIEAVLWRKRPLGPEIRQIDRHTGRCAK